MATMTEHLPATAAVAEAAPLLAFVSAGGVLLGHGQAAALPRGPAATLGARVG
ncbi:isochorismate synthase, partial [Pseudoroseomonas wenyumeiae]